LEEKKTLFDKMEMHLDLAYMRPFSLSVPHQPLLIFGEEALGLLENPIRTVVVTKIL
jgi:hypothetical protein